MKKTLALLVSITFLGSSLSVPAYAAVKAGAKCATKGQVKTLKGKKFKCVKIGKKLSWSKATAVVGKTKSQVSEVPNSQEIDLSINNLDAKGIPLQAYKEVVSVLASRAKSGVAPTYLVGPNLDKSRVDQEVAGVNRTLDLWSPYFKPDRIRIIYVGKGDENWLEKQSELLGLNSMVPPGETWTQRFKLGNECSFGMSGTPQGIPTLVQCLGARYDGEYKQNGPHEITHQFQVGYGGSNAFLIPWYTEGSAIFFGWVLGFYSDDSAISERDLWLEKLFRVISPDSAADFKSKELSRFKSRMDVLSKPTSNYGDVIAAYWAGNLATEVLVALYGVEKYVELTKNLEKGATISDSLLQTYGFKSDYFYERLAPYIWKQLG